MLGRTGPVCPPGPPPPSVACAPVPHCASKFSTPGAPQASGNAVTFIITPSAGTSKVCYRTVCDPSHAAIVCTRPKHRNALQKSMSTTRKPNGTGPSARVDGRGRRSALAGWSSRGAAHHLAGGHLSPERRGVSRLLHGRLLASSPRRKTQIALADGGSGAATRCGRGRGSEAVRLIKVTTIGCLLIDFFI